MCEFCKEDNNVIHTENCNNCDIEVFIEKDKTLCINAYNHETEYTENICFSFAIDFCPKCGRKLDH